MDEKAKKPDDWDDEEDGPLARDMSSLNWRMMRMPQGAIRYSEISQNMAILRANCYTT